MPGRTIGNYEIKRLIGQGGMGAVYLAEHTLLGRQAAIKLLLPNVSADEEIVQRFFDEARATTSVNDPGIVQIFDFGYHVDGSAFIVMEYLEGETLDNRLEREGPLLAVPALRIARQVAMALHAAHLQGIVHRDLKLENVLMVQDPAVPGGERAKILDFGIAKLSRTDDRRKSRTLTGSILGTPIYMSPEQCRGASDVDGRADVYALGCLLFCLVTGRPPFDYPSNGEIIAAHLKERAPKASSRMRGVTPELDEIIARCLAKDLDERYQTMAELASDITEVLTGADRSITSPALRHLSSAGRSRPARPTTLTGAARMSLPGITSRSLHELGGGTRRKAFVGTLAAVVLTFLVAAGATWRRDDRGVPNASASEPAQRAPEAPLPSAGVAQPRTVEHAGAIPPTLPATNEVRSVDVAPPDEAPALTQQVPDTTAAEAPSARDVARPTTAKPAPRPRWNRAKPARTAPARTTPPRARRVLVDQARDASTSPEPTLRVRDVDRGD